MTKKIEVKSGEICVGVISMEVATNAKIFGYNGKEWSCI